jgi:hypothetical protein
MNFLIINLLNDGGPLFMYTTLVLLIICIVLIAKAFTKEDSEGKTVKLISSVSLFALVWGFLGLLIGLIGGFDAISAQGDIAPGILAAGLKIGLLSPSFGMFTFLIARLGIIGLQLKK